MRPVHASAAAPRRGALGHAIRSAAPWVVVCAITAAVQYARGAPVDGAVFSVVAVALGIDAVSRRVEKARMRPPTRLGMTVIVVIAGVALVLAPRHGPVSGIVVIALGVAVLPIAWRGIRGAPHEEDDEQSALRWRRSAWAWSIVIVALALVELAAWLADELDASEAIAAIGPSISQVLDDPLDDVWTHALFVVAWLALGAMLVRRGGDA